jgi:hypothetical protein
MRTRRELFQWGVRNCLAAIFWLHAITLTTLLTYWPWWNKASRVAILQTVLIAAILFYSYIAQNAGWSMLVDALYIYAYPVIVLGRLSWISLKRVWGVLSKISPALASISTQKINQPAATPNPIDKTDPVEEVGIGHHLLKPFLHFSVLWCVLVTVSKEKWILGLSLIALLSIASRAVISLHTSLNDASSLMEKINLRLKGAVEKFTNDLLNAAPTSQEFKNSVTNVRVYGALFRYLKSSEAVRKVTRKFTLAIAIPTYIYTSILCGFLYYDIAVLAGIKWPLGEALIDSLYMPIAFTDLPHNYPIRILGGMQVASLILIGYDAIFRSINDSMEKLAGVAKGLSSLMESDSVAKALATYDAQQASEAAAKVIEAPVDLALQKAESE